MAAAVRRVSALCRLRAGSAPPRRAWARRPNSTLAPAAGGRDPLFNPTPEHAHLREVVAEFARTEVDKQAAEHDAKG